MIEILIAFIISHEAYVVSIDNEYYFWLLVFTKNVMSKVLNDIQHNGENSWNLIFAFREVLHILPKSYPIQS